MSVSGRRFGKGSNLKVLSLLLAATMMAAACANRVNEGPVATGSPADAPSTDGASSGTTGGSSGTTGDVSGTDGGSSGTDGGSSGTTGGSSGPGTASDGGVNDPGVTDTEIRIGFTAPIAGLAGDILGRSGVDALDAYFQWVNARGGINGRKLRLITYDNNSDLTRDADNARRLVEQDRAVILLATLPDYIADYVTRKQVPTIVLGLSAAAFSSKFPTVYPILQSNVSATYAFTNALKEAGVAKQGMKVGVLYHTKLLDTSPYLANTKDAWAAIGAQVVTTDALEFDDGDCTPLVNKYKNLGIDWWDFQGFTWIFCASAAQRLGYKPNIGWGNWPTNISALVDMAGPYANGVWLMSPADKLDGSPRAQTQAHKDYVEQMQRFKPRAASPAVLTSAVTQTYWMAGIVIERALREMGDVVNTQKLNAYFQGLRNFDVGIAPPIKSWDPNCKVGVDTVWIGQWRTGGEFNEAEQKSGYIDNPVARERFGECYVTGIADRVIGGG
jgi:branched-chain amino acid transport system substrate-binding protein